MGDSLADVAVVDYAPFLEGDRSPGMLEQCKRIAESLRKYGTVVVRDPRVTETDNDNFLDLLERYFEQEREVKMKDARPDWGYQVGVTPNGVELPRDHGERIKNNYNDMCRPHKPVGPDPKWRYFWRIGPRPQETKFQELNANPVLPEAFPEWEDTMNTWGNLMLSAVTAVAKMLALGLDLDEDAFSSMMNNGPHLLAPTASDLSEYGQVGTVLAGFHYDLNFLTIHGKSRYPALNLFLRDDSDAPRKKVTVKVPDGCLLVQAGKQLEWLTGGEILAGFHEVIVQEATVKKLEERKAAGQSQWRISSTLFSHIASDQTLRPLDQFAEKADAEMYPPTLTGDYVSQELAVIKLGKVVN